MTAGNPLLHPTAGMPRRPRHGERGIAILVSLMAMLLLSALGAALLLTTTTEVAIAAHYRDGLEAMYAADAGIERALQDLLTLSDWNGVLASDDGVRARVMSGFAAGSLAPRLGDGRVLDIARLTAALNCPDVSPPPAACSDGQMNRPTADRPWGPNNPRWHVYAHGPITDLLSTASIDSPFYLIVWVADDGAEGDGDPMVDAVGVDDPGRGVILVRADAFGPSGAHRVVEVTLARGGEPPGAAGYTGQGGNDEQARRAGRPAVETPGRALTRSAMDLGAGGLR